MKKKLEILKKNIFLCIAIVVSLSLLFFVNENIPKVITLEIFIWLWYFIGQKLQTFSYSSLLLILIILPFNISLQVYLPSTDPYVNGLFTNYLVPTISILDLFASLFLLSSVLERKFKKEYLTWELLILFLLPLFQVFLGSEVVSILGVTRIILYLLCFRVVIDNKKTTKKSKYLILITVVSVCIQLLIAVLQFQGGSSIGLSFLGESIFSSGMKGSSFLDISGNLYIRGYGTFPHPNILAGWFLMCMAFLWKSKKGLLFLILSSSGIILTFSRLGIFLMVIFWLMYIYEYLRRRKNISLFSFIPLVRERMINLFNGGDGAITDRVNLI